MAKAKSQKKTLVSGSGMPALNSNQMHTNPLVGQITASSPTKTRLELQLSFTCLLLCQDNLTESHSDTLQSSQPSEQFSLPCFGGFLLGVPVKRNKKASHCNRQDSLHHFQLLSKGIPEVHCALINQQKISRFPGSWKLEFCSEGKRLSS